MNACQEGGGPQGSPITRSLAAMAGRGLGRALVACTARPHLYLLASDLRGAGGPGRGVQVALTHHVLEQVDQQGAGVSTAMHVHHIVGAAQLEEWLVLRGWGRVSAWVLAPPDLDRTGPGLPWGGQPGAVSQLPFEHMGKLSLESKRGFAQGHLRKQECTPA